MIDRFFNCFGKLRCPLSPSLSFSFSVERKKNDEQNTLIQDLKYEKYDSVYSMIANVESSVSKWLYISRFGSHKQGLGLDYC